MKLWQGLVFLCVGSCFSASNIKVGSNNSTIRVATGANFIVKNNIVDFEGTLQIDEGAVVSGAQIQFANGGHVDNSKHSSSSFSINLTTERKELIGNQSVQFGVGSKTERITVAGQNNRIEGAPTLLDAIVLQDSSTTLTVSVQNSLAQNIDLNGGHLLIDEDLRFSNDRMITGSGSINLNTLELHLGARDQTLTSTLYVDGAGGTIFINSRVEFDSTLTFSGSCVIDGNGNIINMNTGLFRVEHGSTLKLKDLVIKGVKESNIAGLADDSIIAFENVGIVLDDDFTFTKGACHFSDFVKVSGSSTFVYQTVATSTIKDKTRFELDSGITFSYDPPVNESSLLGFVDDTSLFVMRDSTLYTTVTGMQLLRGKLLVKGNSRLTGDSYFDQTQGTTFAGHFYLGNQITGSDMKLEITGGAQLSITSGYLDIQNKNQSSHTFINNLSTLAIKTGARLRLHESMDLGFGRVVFEDNSWLEKTSLVSLNGGVHVEGVINHALF